MKSRVNVKIKENFRAQNLSSAAMVFIYKNLGRLGGWVPAGTCQVPLPCGVGCPTLLKYLCASPYILVILSLQERRSVILSSQCRPWSTTNTFLFCLFTKCFFLLYHTNFLLSHSAKYVRFCYSCPNRPCPVPASFFLGGRSLNIENSSFSAWRIL